MRGSYSSSWINEKVVDNSGSWARIREKYHLKRIIENYF
jgi:hypothetical protein